MLVRPIKIVFSDPYLANFYPVYSLAASLTNPHHETLPELISFQVFKQSFDLFSEDQKESPTELAFKYAVFKINKAKDVLPNNSLTYDIQYVPSEDSFRTTKKVNKYMIT